MTPSRIVVVFYLSLTVVLLTLTLVQTKYCPLNSTNKTELREPIILTNSTGKLEFYIPSLNKGKLIFDQEQKIILVCPNPRNILNISNSNTTTAQCTNGKLKVVGKFVTYQDLSCNKSVRGDIRKRSGKDAKCGSDNQGHLIDIGYKVKVMPGRNKLDFVPLIKVCHDLSQGNTLYSEHIIHGKLMKQASKSKFRPGFSTQGLESSASVAYKQSYQKSTFNKLLGSSLLADNYINNKSFLSRGHLAADADFLFAPWQFSTYFYLNAVPQWQAVNGGNWHKVESLVRKLAGQLETDLRIITGSYGVLSLFGDDQEEKEIYLLPKNVLPVPKLIWKLVYNPKTKEAVVLVISNNPFVKDLSEVEKICDDICQDYGWNQDNWKRVERGVVYCCDYSSFVDVYRDLLIRDVSGVLRGPNK